MANQYYTGIFINPSVTFLYEYSEKEDITSEFWHEVGNVLEIISVVSYRYKNRDVPINIHKIGFLSIDDAELDCNDMDADLLAYLILYSFTGAMGWFISSEIHTTGTHIEKFYYDCKRESYHRCPASDKFSYVLQLNAIKNVKSDQTPFRCISMLSKIHGASYAHEKLDKFVSGVNEKIKEKRSNVFDDEYYFLMSSLRKNDAIGFSEGVLISGWAICEYLICLLFEKTSCNNTKITRLEYFNDIKKCPFAFSAKTGKQRTYKNTVNKSDCDSSHKLECLKSEKVVIGCVEKIEIIRGMRNRYLHNPAKEAINILNKNRHDLSKDIYSCIYDLKNSF